MRQKLPRHRGKWDAVRRMIEEKPETEQISVRLTLKSLAGLEKLKKIFKRDRTWLIQTFVDRGLAQELPKAPNDDRSDRK